DTGARVTKSRVFDLGTQWDATDKLSVRAEVSLSTSKSRFPNFSTTLDFINPNGPQPVIGQSLDNGVPLAFDLRRGTLQLGIEQTRSFAPTTRQLPGHATHRGQQVAQGGNTTDEHGRAGRLGVDYDTSDLNPVVTSGDIGYRWNRTSAENVEFSR